MSNVGFEAKPLSRRDIRRFAIQVRKALGYADRPYIDIEEVLDFVLPKAFSGFEYAIHSREEMGDNHGLADPENRAIILREDIFERACDGEGPTD